MDRFQERYLQAVIVEELADLAIEIFREVSRLAILVDHLQGVRVGSCGRFRIEEQRPACSMNAFLDTPGAIELFGCTAADSDGVSQNCRKQTDPRTRQSLQYLSHPGSTSIVSAVRNEIDRIAEGWRTKHLGGFANRGPQPRLTLREVLAILQCFQQERYLGAVLA